MERVLLARLDERPPVEPVESGNGTIRLSMPGGELAGALQQKGFQELAEYVLESAIFAILQESAHS